jgi:hypothetical protein
MLYLFISGDYIGQIRAISWTEIRQSVKKEYYITVIQEERKMRKYPE